MTCLAPLALLALTWAPPGGPAAPAAPPAAVAGQAPVPLELRPYTIRLRLNCESSTRLDRRGRELLVAEWLGLVRRFVGAPWQIELRDGPDDPLARTDPDSLTPETAAPGAAVVDKVWVIAVSGVGSGYEFRGREYDAATRRVGPLQRRPAPVVRDAPRVLLRFALELFAPSALIGERFGKDVQLTVQGAALAPASETGRVTQPGQVFLPLRVVPRKDGPPAVQEVAFTYLRVEGLTHAGASCSVVSALSDPFTKRVIQKSYLAALGVRPGASPTRLRFTTLPDRAPAAGYVLTARSYPTGGLRDVGTTDREGRITLKPGLTSGLTVFRLLAGSAEPMVEFPLVAGLGEAERAIPPFNPRSAAVTLETRLDSLRDAVVDLVALRARLEARIKARFDGEDWPGVEEGLREFATLPPKSSFAEQISQLREQAAQEQAKTKSAVLTKTAQAQLADLQVLIDRYLDDEVFLGFTDALDRLKNAPAAKPKARGKAGVAAPPKVAPVTTPPASKAVVPPRAATPPITPAGRPRAATPDRRVAF